MLALSGDIISEVAAAADPQRALAARRRLESFASQDAGEFAKLVDPGDRHIPRPATGAAPTVAQGVKKALARQDESSDPSAMAYRALGGVLLQKTFETLMPKLGAAMGSKSSASAVWSSMLAQQLADCVSASVFRGSHAGANAAASRTATPPSGTTPLPTLET